MDGLGDRRGGAIGSQLVAVEIVCRRRRAVGSVAGLPHAPPGGVVREIGDVPPVKQDRGQPPLTVVAVSPFVRTFHLGDNVAGGIESPRGHSSAASRGAPRQTTL